MVELAALLPAWMAGLALGTVFYGGLYWTVRRGLASMRPGLWFFVSALARTGVALGGLLAVSEGQWQRLAACLVGFFLARVAVTLLTRPAAKAGHAP